MTHTRALRTGTGVQLQHIAMPVGGIGTGCISLGGRGQLRDWEIFNDPNVGFSPAHSFFVLRFDDGEQVGIRVLEGVPQGIELAGPHGAPSPHAGLPRFRDAAFAATYPFGHVSLSDPAVPVTVTLEVFNPLIPGDADASGYPLVHYRARLRNTGGRSVRLAVCGNLADVVGGQTLTAGQPGRLPAPPSARFDTSELPGGSMLLGSAPPSDALPADHPTMGTVALACLDGRADSVRTGWTGLAWGDALSEFFDDFVDDGRLDDPAGDTDPTGSLVRTLELAPDAEGAVEFVIAWHFPNRYGWGEEAPGGVRPWIGNHYATRFADAAEVVRDYAPRRAELEQRTRAFVDGLVDLPATLAEAALASLSVLKSPTCFRDAEGRFLAWEGCNPSSGSCHGSCNHVWNYTYPLEDLFPELAWTMREIEFGPAMAPDGRMSFRVGLPLAERGNHWPVAAADGQPGTVLRLLRTMRRAPDTDRLARLWPHVRAAVEYAWVPGGWDADADGVMEGCQHNTMDVEWYGPSGTIQSWYLAGLAAAEELVGLLGDYASEDDRRFAERCRDIRLRGAAWTDEVLFTGRYYPQQLRPARPEDIAAGLRHPRAGEHDTDEDLADPPMQLGGGCIADQLAGDSMALLAGIDTGLSPAHRATAWQSVVTHNTRTDFSGELNTRRTYAAGEEAGLLVCSYPDGGKPRRPFPYHHEVWTGLEYTTAVGLLLTGDPDAAVDVVTATRARYDGSRRNPFNEVECGAHYARVLAAWGMVEAWRATHPLQDRPEQDRA